MRGALLSPLSAISGIFTYVLDSTDDHQTSIAQVIHPSGSTVAHCRFLAPLNALDSLTLSELLEGLLREVGARGAHSLVAEVEEDSLAFGALRQNGFSIFARQQVWKFDKAQRKPERSIWRHALERDELSISVLRNGLIPGQVQQIESNQNTPDGYVVFNNGQLHAYVEVKRGSRGIWLQPFVSLDAEPFDLALNDLIARLRPQVNRPAYICVRSYQDGLRNPLQRLGAEPGASQAVMAKRTTLPLKSEEARRIPVTNRSAEPTTPIHAPLPRVREPEWITYDQTPNYR